MLNLAPLCIFALAKQQQPLFVLSPSLIDLTAENIDKLLPCLLLCITIVGYIVYYCYYFH